MMGKQARDDSRTTCNQSQVFRLIEKYQSTSATSSQKSQLKRGNRRKDPKIFPPPEPGQQSRCIHTSATTRHSVVA